MAGRLMSGLGAWTTERLSRVFESEDAGRVVCGREALRLLPGGRGILAREGGEVGRRVVLKPLPTDCLDASGGGGQVGGGLHEHVHARLSRVRELADVRVAGLHGVEVDEVLGPVMVWEWVEGEELPVAVREAGLLGKCSVLEVAREVVAGVERLHLLGIVHGALHLRNVIARPYHAAARAGSVSAAGLVLTHVSPLVIDDPRRDLADLRRLLRDLNGSPVVGGGSALLSRILAEWDEGTELAGLRERLAVTEGPQFVQGRDPTPPRGRSVMGAVVVAAVGVLVAGAVMGWYAWG